MLLSPCNLLDIHFQGPVGNGKVICISVYAGEDFDFGFGKGHALWVENIDKACDTYIHAD